MIAVAAVAAVGALVFGVWLLRRELRLWRSMNNNVDSPLRDELLRDFRAKVHG